MLAQSTSAVGDNPAVIQVGGTYADLGATVTGTGPGQAGDANLGYQTFLNGTLVSNITIDTSEVATDTVQYVATDTAGLTAPARELSSSSPYPKQPQAQLQLNSGWSPSLKSLD
jgi:hypothetical protein